MDDTDAELYAEGVRRGETLLSVQVDESNVSSTRDVLNQYNPTDVHNESSSWRSEGWSKFDESASPYEHTDVETYRSRSNNSASAATGSAIGVYPVNK
jgi:hypothetical protein